MKLKSLRDIFEDQIRDIYSSESQILKLYPKLLKKISSVRLAGVIEQHFAETKEQQKMLKKIAAGLKFRPGGKRSRAIRGLIEECSALLEAKGESCLIDAAIIAAMQRIEHYEISAYGSARSVAAQLGYFDVVEVLQDCLDQETIADEKLSLISEEDLLPQAPDDTDAVFSRRVHESGSIGY